MRLAVVQSAPIFADADSNSNSIAERIRSLAEESAEFIVFPEAAVTGYCFSSREQAASAAVECSGPHLARIEEACCKNGVWAVVGFAENLGGTLYNSAGLWGPSGLVGVYRKTHLPCLGLDRFVAPGNSLPVFDTPFGKVGILICYDIRVPEATRSLALDGADLVCLPTNWPESAQPSSEIVCPTRALENHVFVAASSRVGEENGFRFIGLSRIVAPGGVTLASLGADEGALTCDIDLGVSRQKHIVRRPGEYEIDILESRRPDLYENLNRRQRA
jgi:predicted amidohydrolase